MLASVEQTSLDETRQRIKELNVAIEKYELKKIWWKRLFSIPFKFQKMLTTVEQTSLDETRQRIKELNVTIEKYEIKKIWWNTKMDSLKALLEIHDRRLLNIDQEVAEYRLELVKSINLKKSLVSNQIVEYNGQCLHLGAKRTPFYNLHGYQIVSCSMCGEKL